MNKDRNAKANQSSTLCRNVAIKVVWLGWMMQRVAEVVGKGEARMWWCNRLGLFGF